MPGTGLEGKETRLLGDCCLCTDEEGSGWTARRTTYLSSGSEDRSSSQGGDLWNLKSIDYCRQMVCVMVWERQVEREWELPIHSSGMSQESKGGDISMGCSLTQ